MTVDYYEDEERTPNNKVLELTEKQYELNKKTYDIIKIFLPGCFACQITLIVLAIILGLYTLRNNSKLRSDAKV